MTADAALRLSPREALMASMVLMAAADGNGATDAELHRMKSLVADLPAFGGSDAAEVEVASEVVVGLLAEADGIEKASELIRDALPPRLRETAYLLACEIAAADGEANQDELRLLQDFRIMLDIDRLIAGAIERAAKARYQVI
jgi:tellurite resistance protein